MSQLDGFFKNKLDDQEVPFNEAHWLAAQDLIDGQQQQRRAIWWWRIGCLSVAIGVAVFLLIPRWTELESFVVEQEQPTEEINAPNTPGIKAVPTPKTEALPNTSQAPQRNGQTPLPASSRTTVVSPSPEVSKQPVSPAQETRPSSSESATANPDMSPPAASTPTQPTQALNALADDQPAGTNSPASKVADALLPIPTLTFELAETESELPPIDAITSSPQRAWQLSTLLGSTISPNQPQLGPVIGLRLERKLGGKISMYAEAVYRSQAFRESLTNNSLQEQYGFGLRKEDYTLEASSLHYTDLNIGLAYHYLRHHYHLGAGASYLFGARGTLNQNITRETTRFASGPSAIEEGWVAKDGLRDWAFRIQSGYEYYLLPSLSLGLRLQYRLHSISVTDSKVNAPFSVDFMIKYSLW